MQILNTKKLLIGRLWRKGTAAFTLLLCASLLIQSTTPVQNTAISKEYQVKALFLFNFTQFIEWPAETFAVANAPFVVGILGEDPFGFYLDEIVKGETVNSHALVVRRFDNVEDVKDCHILFINIPRKEDIREALAALRSQSILTVSDNEGFTRNGGMIQLFLKDNKIRIRIDLETTRNADIVISSKLLRLAEIDSSNK